MPEAINMAGAFAAGAALGLIYFSLLWLTVKRLPDAGNPALLMLGSFIVRTAGAVLGIFLVMDGSWQRAAACVLGFMIARKAATMRLKPQREIEKHMQSEAD